MKLHFHLPACGLLAAGALTACVPLAALGQVPNAGSLQQQVQPTVPAVPAPAVPRVTIEDGVRAPMPATAPFEVRTILITGNTVFDTPTLHALVAEGEGKNLTLRELEELAGRITDYYRRRGYSLSRAIIPAQVIRDGLATIDIIEARYGRVGMENRSLAADGLLQATLAPLQGGEAIEQSKLDSTLLLLSDIPGVLPSAVFRPGERTGTADLTVSADAAPAVTGAVSLDNFGNRYTGRERVSGALGWANPLRFGDLLSLNALSSGSRLNYAQAAYESVLSGHGTRLGASYSALSYELGEEFAALLAHGTSRVPSAWLRQPLLRSRNANVYAQVQYDRPRLRDRIDAVALRNDRTLGNTSLTLSGDVNDALDGVNAWSLGWTGGQVDLEDASARSLDSATARTQGGFSKFNASYARLQPLSSLDSLKVAIAGQRANSNLDAWDKLSVGGAFSVRGYEGGILSGDSGYQATVEYRRVLGQALQGHWQGTVFADTAHLKINAQPWTAEENTARLSGAGLGLNWAGPLLWHAMVSVARPVGAAPAALAGHRSTRTWVEIAKAF